MTPPSQKATNPAAAASADPPGSHPIKGSLWEGAVKLHFTNPNLTEGESVTISSLPQSKIGSEKPIFASPLTEGAFRRRCRAGA